MLAEAKCILSCCLIRLDGVQKSNAPREYFRWNINYSLFWFYSHHGRSLAEQRCKYHRKLSLRRRIVYGNIGGVEVLSALETRTCIYLLAKQNVEQLLGNPYIITRENEWYWSSHYLRNAARGSISFLSSADITLPMDKYSISMTFIGRCQYPERSSYAFR